MTRPYTHTEVSVTGDSAITTTTGDNTLCDAPTLLHDPTLTLW